MVQDYLRKSYEAQTLFTTMIEVVRNNLNHQSHIIMVQDYLRKRVMIIVFILKDTFPT